MTIISEEQTLEAIAENSLADLPYHLALNQCEAICQSWGGVRDGQIRAIIDELTGVNSRTRSSYYWQLRVHFPNPYE